MSKFLIVLLVFVILSILGFFSFPLIKNAYSDWQARKTVYTAESIISKYPGSGRVTEYFAEKIFVLPKGLGRPFFDGIHAKNQYTEDKYDVFTIPSQDQLLYSVELFERWEDIPSSRDKYAVVKNPQTKEISRYRICFEQSDLFGDNATSIGVETLEIDTDTAKNTIQNLKESSLVILGFEKIKEIIKKGDALVFIPLFDPPELAKTDQNGNYLASWVIVRRLKGLDI